jgi:hypothetical protein
MTSPFVPIGLFVALVLSVVAAIPLSSSKSGLALLSVIGFMGALGALAWVVLRTDRDADPHRRLLAAADRFDDGWPRFERDFWAHVARRDARRGSSSASPSE